MTCIHGFGNSVIDYVISDIPTHNQLINVYILNNHEPNSDHTRFLILTLNIVIWGCPIEENSNNQMHLIFDKNKSSLFLNEIKIN